MAKTPKEELAEFEASVMWNMGKNSSSADLASYEDEIKRSKAAEIALAKQESEEALQEAAFIETPTSFTDVLNVAGTAFGQAAGFNFADELAQQYTKATDEERAAANKLAEAERNKNAITATAGLLGDVAGSIPGGILAARRLAARFIPAAGVASGALSGAGGGETPEERAIGAAVGGTLGYAVPKAAEKVTKTVAPLVAKLVPEIPDVTGAARKALISDMPDVTLRRTSAGETKMVPVSNEGMRPANVNVERKPIVSKPEKDPFLFIDEAGAQVIPLKTANNTPGDFIGVANKNEPDVNVRLESAKQKIQEKALAKKPELSEDELPTVEISPEGNAVTIRDPYNPQIESYLALDEDGIARGQVVTQYEKFAGRGKPKEKVKSDAFTGTEAIDASFYVFGDKLKGLEAIWKNDPGLTTNTAAFQKNVHDLIDSGLSREAAELESFKNTFTGRLMKKYGFTEAEPTSIDFELDQAGKPIYNEVKVIFTKPQKSRSLSSAAAGFTEDKFPYQEGSQGLLFAPHEMTGVKREPAQLAAYRKAFEDLGISPDWKPTSETLKASIPIIQKQLSAAQNALVDAPDAAARKQIRNKINELYNELATVKTQLEGKRFEAAEQMTLRPISPEEKIAMDIAKRSGMQMYPDIEQPLLGSGKAGDVYKVYDPETRAMKLVNPEFRRNAFQWMYGREEATTRKQIEDVRNFLPENVSKHLMQTRKNVEMPEEGSMMKTGYAFTGDIMEPMDPATFPRFKKIFDDLSVFSKPTPELKKQIKALSPKERSFARAILHLGTKEGFDFSKASLDYNNIMINPKTGDYVLTDLGEIGIIPPTSRTLKTLPSSKSPMRKKSSGESPGGGLPMRFEDTPYKRGLMEREAFRRDQEFYLNEISRKFGDTPDETNPEYKKLVQEAAKAGNAYAKLVTKYPTSQDFENERAWINEQIRVIEERFKDKKRPYYERLKELETAYETATIDIKPDIEAKIAKIDQQVQLLDKDEIDKLEPYVSDSRKNINDFIEAVRNNPEMLEVTDPSSDLMFHYNNYLSRKKTNKESVADALETVGKDSKLIQRLIDKLRGKKGGGGSGGEGGSGGMPPGGTPPPQLPPAGGSKARAKDELIKAPKENTPFSNIQTDNPKTLVKEFEKYFQKQKTPITTVEGGVSYETAPIVYQRPGGPPVIGLNEKIKQMDLPKIYPRLERDIVKYETSLEPAVEEYNNLQNLIKTATDQQIRDAAVIRSTQLKTFIDDQRYELAQRKIAHIYGQRPDWLDEIIVTNKGRRIKTPKVFIEWDRNSNTFSIKDMTEDAGNLYYASGSVNDDGVMVNNNIYTVDFGAPIDPATGQRPRSKMFRGAELMQYYMYFYRNSVKAIRELYVEGNHETFQKIFDNAYPVLRYQHSQKIAEELALREAAAGTFSGKQHLSRGFDIKAVVGERYKAGDLGYPSAMYDIRPKTKGSGGKI